ncbi:hypothetical protein Q3G72_020677 [Acer saccharum]|nr:hypothetical protein Q3G72_020677 [Acer saccharum]
MLGQDRRRLAYRRRRFEEKTMKIDVPKFLAGEIEQPVKSTRGGKRAGAGKRPAGLRESHIEQRLVQRVKQLGGEVRKVKWIGRSGAPDRLVMLPNSFYLVQDQYDPRPIWIELKAPGKKAEPHQLREHERMRKMGQRVELDYWVARAEGFSIGDVTVERVQRTDNFEYEKRVIVHWPSDRAEFNPSTDWVKGGPLIERYKVFVKAPRDYSANRDHWVADIDGGDCSYFGKGDTPLQAICRAVVRAAFGDEVEEVGATLAAQYAQAVTLLAAKLKLAEVSEIEARRLLKLESEELVYLRAQAACSHGPWGHNAGYDICLSCNYREENDERTC